MMKRCYRGVGLNELLGGALAKRFYEHSQIAACAVTGSYLTVAYPNTLNFSGCSTPAHMPHSQPRKCPRHCLYSLAWPEHTRGHTTYARGHSHCYRRHLMSRQMCRRLNSYRTLGDS